jgi:Zn finger protein HypA/HybF involved in hydrogenase expression
VSKIEWDTSRESIECCRCLGTGVVVGVKEWMRAAYLRCPKCRGTGFRIVKRKDSAMASEIVGELRELRMTRQYWQLSQRSDQGE